MKLILALLFSLPLLAQQQYRWVTQASAVSVTSSYTVTIQQAASNNPQIFIDQMTFSSSSAYTVQMIANGTPATATAGTITPLLPSPLNTPVPFNVFVASNVGSGTAQSAVISIPAGSPPITLCFTQSCGNPAQVSIGTGGTAANYSFVVTLSSGTLDYGIYGRWQ